MASFWLCLTLCDPMDYSPPGSSVLGILQARILEWSSCSLLQGSFPIRDRTRVFHITSRFYPSEPPGKHLITYLKVISLIISICSRWFPWQSSREDSTLPLLGSQVRSLLRELRSHKLHDPIKFKKKKNLKTEQISVPVASWTVSPAKFISWRSPNPPPRTSECNCIWGECL